MSVLEIKKLIDNEEITKSHGIIFNKILELKNKQVCYNTGKVIFMKKVGIIFAMEEQLLALKEYLKLEKEYSIFELKFYEGTINGISCVLVQSSS